MTLGVLSFSDRFYTTRRLLEAAAAAGREAVWINPIRTTIHIGLGRTTATVDGEPLPPPAAVIPRVGATHTEYALALLQALMDAGAASLAEPAALRLAADKLRTGQQLARAGIPTVPSVAVREPAHIEHALDAVGGPPVVMKLRHGSRGGNVLSAHDRKGAASVLGTLIGLGHTVIVQPFVRMQEAHDVRVLVVAGVPLAACRRVAPPGEFRSNVHRGAVVEPLELDDATSALAARSAEAVGLPLCGVDLLPTADRGPLVLEVNGSPGLEGIERATGRDLAREIVESYARTS